MVLPPPLTKGRTLAKVLFCSVAGPFFLEAPHPKRKSSFSPRKLSPWFPKFLMLYWRRTKIMLTPPPQNCRSKNGPAREDDGDLPGINNKKKRWVSPILIKTLGEGENFPKVDKKPEEERKGGGGGGGGRWGGERGWKKKRCSWY